MTWPAFFMMLFVMILWTPAPIAGYTAGAGDD
jgi:hypothetical protein